MCRIYFIVVLLCLLGLRTNPALAQSITLTDGTVLHGEAVSFSDQGLVVKLDTGAYSERVAWTKLTQESLKELLKNSKAASFAEPYLEVPLEEKQKAKQKEIVVKPVPGKMERPKERVSLFAALTTPAGLLVVIALFLANIYAGYEVAVFRNQSAALVCAVSAFLPVFGPVIFLCLPAQEVTGEATEPAASPHESLLESSMASAPNLAHGLNIATLGKSSGAPAQAAATYRRGEVTFDRRFFETRLSGYFRVVPAEAEKDMVIVIRSPRAEYVAKRISRITASEMFIQLQKGGASEVNVSFGEIVEVQVRHKDAKG